ncbi:Glutathione S-transferase S1-like Protein [Tribolium castaneum]|uniref:glutathione transferase n=1 Tax=Tribolium castaneum TaxID=7070 RepID=D6WD87_TRICA|nr:PREDICTED: glutathione S-transferase [Tribolium castaneum]EEZ99492.1 Glutathione S-transferase S1-like Protein [Tribolium castaneum]|eukprot:XP_969146.1 PREDICTED: glutathione S-transferase [Tribolium castaneum]
MAPAYKLTYFDGRGLAETSRFIMKYGGIDFEDCRIKREDWPQIKSKYPFGQLPVLEHNGKTVNQSHSIARYLAKQVKLAGNDDWENLEIDAIVDTFNDLRLKIVAYFYEQDEEKKKTILENLNKDVFPQYLTRFEEIVKKNKGYFALGRLTWADFCWATVSPGFDMITKVDTIANYPELKAVRDKVNSLPAIKKWIEQRPKTDF